MIKNEEKSVSLHPRYSNNHHVVRYHSIKTTIAYRQTKNTELPCSVKKAWSPIETLLGSFFE